MYRDFSLGAGSLHVRVALTRQHPQGRRVEARKGAGHSSCTPPTPHGYSPWMTCSGEMVFFSDLLQISLASEEIR